MTIELEELSHDQNIYVAYMIIYWALI